MKRFYAYKPTYRLLAFFFLLNTLVPAVLFGQNTQMQKVESKKEYLSTEQYNLRKASGQLLPGVEYIVNSPLNSGVFKHKPVKGGAKSSRILKSPPCRYVPTDDFDDPWGGDVYFDDSPPAGPFEVPIPFTFCFYDQSYTSFFINNNGNITFDAQYVTFTSTGFPSATVPPMIAPFWGDVDTGDDFNPLGQVRYDVYPDYAIVSWDTVGVYPGSNPNQRNTFQLIITDGVSPVLPPQTNICFIYADMQWTTGTASQGSGGFGGTPATVGVNRGDGVDYIQLGRFDAPGTNYDGPFGNSDQVDFLDNTIFFFNTCLTPGADNNIAPLSLGAPICDTLVVCTGGTIPIDFFFIPVEPGQTVDAEALTTNLPGLNIAAITPGAQCAVSATFTGDSQNLGYQTISFLATDDGTPAATYQLDITINVLESNFTPVITGTPAICSGQSTTLSVAGGPFDDYLWSPSFDQTPTTEITESATVVVTVSGNGQCGVSEPFLVDVAQNPTPVITGGDTVCNDGTVILYTTQPYDQYSWSNAQSNDTIQVPAGGYIVSVIDSNGCQGISSQFNVISVASIIPQIIGDSITCYDELAAITTNQSYLSYDWSTLQSDPAISVGAGIYTVSVVDANGCEGTSNPFRVKRYAPNPLVLGVEAFCRFDSISISVQDTFATYSWVYQDTEISDSSAILWDGGNAIDSLFLRIVDTRGCIADVEVFAPYTQLPQANYTTNPVVPETLENTTVQFLDQSTATTGDPITGWNWVLNPPDPFDTLLTQNVTQLFLTNDSVGVTLIVISDLGCRDTLISSLTAPFVPNVFTPNGDGKNDFFKIPFITNLKDNNVIVYNRWGKKVFEADNYTNDWDASNIPSGTYFYVITAPAMEKPKQGTVTVLKD